MAPDINTLPSPAISTASPSTRSPTIMTSTNGDQPVSSSARGESPTGSPRSLSTSLQAAATLNAGLQNEPTQSPSNGSLSRNQRSPSAGRRRSTVLMNLQLNDPSIPGPGEMVNENNHSRQGSFAAMPSASPLPMSGSPRILPTGDPHHHRAPSLGELHQELEAEQEAQVNRLLWTIREQQLQLQQLQGTHGPNSSAAADDSPVVSERSHHGTPAIPIGSVPQSATSPHPAGSFSRSPGIAHHPRSSFDMARADLHRRSRTPSRGASPRLRSTSISGDSEQWNLGGRDESAFYQAETQMLVRENQMLRHRIRDLERQLAESVSATSAQSNPSEPANPSHLTRTTSVDDENQGAASVAEGIASVAIGASKS